MQPGDSASPGLCCGSMRMKINANGTANLFQALVLMLLFDSACAASTQDEPFRVLVLHSTGGNLPVNTDWYNGLVRGFDSRPELVVEIQSEYTDLSRLGHADYVSSLSATYRQKYARNRPHLLIPTYTPALHFLLEHGEDLFPGIPIVFLAADSDYVAARQLAAHVTGITSHPDIAGTVELALDLQPDTRQVAVIVGSGKLDKQLEGRARQALSPFQARVGISWLRGLSLAELREAVRELAPKTVILYLVTLEDRAGRVQVPVNVVRAMSSSAKAPIYGLWDSLLGKGIVGGRLILIEDAGYEAARMGLRILEGELPAAVPVVDRRQNRAAFDGEELLRWRIDEDRLPVGSRVINRRPSVWDEHRTAILAAGLIISIQCLFILGLLLNRAKLRRTQSALKNAHDRRRDAESVVTRQRKSLARFTKERTLGAVATGIAHEINQPLVAIQNYTQAAKRHLESRVDGTSKLIELLGKIEHQAGRAGDIVQGIRSLVNTDTGELRPVALDGLVEQVIRILEPQLENVRCNVNCSPVADVPAVLADELQVQLVVINLLQNAVQSLDSVKGAAEAVIDVDIHQMSDREVQVSVMDRGPGIAPDRAADIFEPYITGRASGTGLGLAICRTIIEAHGGRIWYLRNQFGGATFVFTLPLAGVS